MKKIFKLSIVGAVMFAGAFTSCKKSAFVEDNIDPNTLYSVRPEDQFLAATIGVEDDFEAYYDDYRRIMWWMQMSTDARGNRKNFTRDVSNFNTRYGKIFYGRVGPRLADIPQLISKMPADQQEAYLYEKSIAQIFLSYYAFYVSDINGSIPYTEAFQARYGGTLTPKYDTQSDLFATLDTQLKDAVAALKSTPSVPQKSYGINDQFFKGDVSKWIKTGNAARLRIAMRMIKVDVNRVKTIVNDVLASGADQMSSVEDSWVFVAPGNSFGGGGNFNPVGMRAPKPTLDFMVAKADPRLRLFYSRNLEGQYVGSYTNPDSVAAHAAFYAKGDTAVSTINYRLFDATAQDVAGTAPAVVGNNFYPLITYADVCFMRAELAARGITNEDAAAWYNAGVTGSIKFYDVHAKDANVEGYAPVTDAEIAAYLAMPDIAYNPAKGLDQIASQAYINFYKNPNEAWALYKRTGLPNASSVLSLPVLTSDGAVNPIPRRAPLGLLDATSPNAENRKAAYDEMAQDPGFGQDPNDAFGRVWWDKP